MKTFFNLVQEMQKPGLCHHCGGLRRLFMSDNFEPVILGFLCNWCAYAGGDLAGVSRLQYPPNMRVIRTMCSGMVHPRLVVDALERGIDGVMVMG